MSETQYSADYAKLGTSTCKKCKTKINKGELRIAKMIPSPYSEGDTMKAYHHATCIFDMFLNARPTTKIIESSTDLDGWSNLTFADRELINNQIERVTAARSNKTPTKKGKSKTKKSSADEKSEQEEEKNETTDEKPSQKSNYDVHQVQNDDPKHADNSFRQFRALCAKIAETNGHLAKTALIQDFITHGSDGQSYKGNISLLFHLLLPSKGYKSLTYNLKSKQLCKLFSAVFQINPSEIIEQCEESGDVAETISDFYSENKKVKPPPKTILSNYDIDCYLNKLSQVTREQDQTVLLREITGKSTVNDLRMFIRLIQKDLKINAGPKQIIDSLGSNAYESFQATNDLKSFMQRYLEHKEALQSGSKLTKELSIKIELMTPVHPMLAEPCKSVDFAFKRCPNGLHAEIKYDGERLQLHKDAKNNFKFFSRSLKPVVEHKIQQLSEFVLKAFPRGESMILDGEILLIDRKTKKPLPFGTLGVHKKKEFTEANEAFFIFDCLYYNGESLLHKTLKERREILSKHMTVIENRILLSEMKNINKKSDLTRLINYTIAEGLEGLVLKNPDGIYEPSKRHWLKVKKDYLMEGTMADTADLVVLGAYFGTGKRGGLMSTFLLGCYDEKSDRWFTVAKCANGFDEMTLEKLQVDLKENMKKISKNFDLLPKWIEINRELVPDFIVVDPKKSPVWEITGAEFSRSKQHTANGISIRFPRLTKFRNDKTWKQATSLSYLNELFEKSKPERKTDEQLDEEEENEENFFDFSGSTKDENTKKTSVSVKRKLLEVESDDEEDTKSCKVPKSLLKLKFPEIFKCQCIYLSSSLPEDEAENLKRHIEAFGGKVLSKKESENEIHLSLVTHCVGEKDSVFDQISKAKMKTLSKVTHISLPTVYVWKCIANKSKL